MAACRCDPLFLICCLISLFVLGWTGARSILDWPRQRREAQLWAAPAVAGVSAKWEERRCKILGSGIASRGGCWREYPDGTSSGFNYWNRPDPAFFSECGGLRWCADEHGTCDCLGGDVTFAAAEFNGNMPTLSVEGHFEVVHGATGPVKCSTGAGSPFATDPAPGSAKHCFCTPAHFAAVARKYGGLDGKCNVRANSVYRAEAVSPAVAARKLAGEVAEDDAEELSTFASRSSSAANRREAFEGIQQQWMLPNGRCDQWAVTNGLDSDYPVFLPWALVEERPHTDFTESDADGNTSASTIPRLRCAFSYGAEAASREEKDGAKQLYSKWSSLENATLPCFVRVGGMSADTGCAVALEKVTAFGAEDTAAREMLYLFGYISAMVLPCMPVLLGVCFCMGPCVVRAHSRLPEDDSGSEAEDSSPASASEAQQSLA